MDAAVDRVLSMQTASGGLAYWPGSAAEADFASAYGADFLVARGDLGRAVPEEPLSALLDRLEERLRQGFAGAYAARVLVAAGRPVASFLPALAAGADDPESRAHLAAAWILLGDGERARAVLGNAGDPWAAPRERGGSLHSPVRAAATLLSALAEAAPDDLRVPDLALRLGAHVRRDREATTQDTAAALLALARLERSETSPARGAVTLAGALHAFEGGAPLVLDVGPAAPWTWKIRADAGTTVVIRVEGIPLDVDDADLERGLSVRRTIESAPDGRFRPGQVYRVVLEGVAPEGAENLLVTDILPGGLEIEAAGDPEGSLDPDRVEPRDDRLLLFRSAPLADGRFRHAYLVRAVTTGTFRTAPVEAELLYAPELRARSGGGRTVEVAR